LDALMGQRPGHSNSHRTTRCLSDGSPANRVMGSSCRAVRFGGTCGTCLRFIRLGPGRSPRSSPAPFGNQTPDRGFPGICALVCRCAVPWNLRSDCSTLFLSWFSSSLSIWSWQGTGSTSFSSGRRFPRGSLPLGEETSLSPGWPRERRRGLECA
jgi:hypothetical protein